MYSEPPQELPFQPTNSLEQLLVPPAYATIILPPREARNPQHVDSFRKALNNELADKIASNCLKIVSRDTVPNGTKILWPVVIYSLKPPEIPNGPPIYKARLTGDDSQNPGTGFEAATPDLMDFRMILVRMANLGLRIYSYQRDNRHLAMETSRNRLTCVYRTMFHHYPRIAITPNYSYKSKKLWKG